VGLVRADLASDLEALGEDMPIKILNVQSYPVVGSSWITNFQTLGKADLKITPFNGTLFGEDIEFISLKCGDNIVEPTELTNLYVKFDNYYCFSESNFEVKVLSSGKHTLRFEFGDDIDYSYNNASEIILGEDVFLPTSNEYGEIRYGIDYDDYPINATHRQQIIGTRNAFEDNGWKRIENARSLKGNSGFSMKYIKEDGTHLVDVVDFNISFVEFKLNYNRDNLGEYEFELEEGKLKTKFKILEFNDITFEWDETEVEIEIEEEDFDGIIYRYEGNPLNKKFKFGFNSTEVSFDDPIIDGYLRKESPELGSSQDCLDDSSFEPLTVADTISYGGSRGYKTWRGERAFIRWNVSGIPDGSTIVDTIFQYEGVTTDANSPEIHPMSELFSLPVIASWEDSGNGTAYVDPFEVVIGSGQSQDLGTSADLDLEADLVYDTFTIGLVSKDDECTVDAIDEISTEEADGVNPPPTLNVTYSEPDSTPPAYSDNSTNSTLAGTDILHSLKWTDETELATSGGYVFSFDNGTGTFVNDSWVAFSSNPDWSNVTKTVNSTVGATIRWCVHANDTSDNWNNSETFSYVTTVANTAPSIISNITSPATVYTNTDWKLNITATDPENASFTAYTQFYVNGSASGSVVSHSINKNINTNVANLSSSSFNKGATLIAEMWVSDTEYNSTKTNTTQVTVSNSIPTTPTSIECNGGSCNDTFSGTVEINCSGSTDTDNDEITYIIEKGNETITVGGEDWSLPSFEYRVCFDVNENNGTDLTNFQTNYTIDTQTLITAGKMNGTCNDIRPYVNSTNTSLYYWFADDGCNTTSTNIFFKINLTASTPKAVCIYYGDNSVSNARDGDNTFIFFDDFSGDLSKWNIDAENTDSIYIVDGTLRHDPDSTQTKNAYSDSRCNVSSLALSNFILNYKIYLGGASNRKIHQMGWRTSLAFNEGYAWRNQNSASDGGFFEFAGGSWSAIGTAYGAISPDTWYSMEIHANSTDMDAYSDGVLVKTVADSTTTSGGGITSHVHGVSLSNGTDYVLIDDVIVREYTSNMPTVTTGSEENYTSQAGSTSYDYTIVGNHTEGNTYSWDLSSENVGEIYERFRCNATDLIDYSDYYTIHSNFTIEVAPEDTCNPTSPLSADYIFDCNDNCTQDATLNANGYNIIWNNAGNYYLEANIENVRNMTIANACNFYKGNGNITIMDN